MKPVEYTGVRFDRLIGLRRASVNKSGAAIWLWRCDCGNEKAINPSSVKRGLTRSCGCLQNEARTSHGWFGTPTYAAWLQMKARVSGKSEASRRHYVRRGIKICPEWQSDFARFLADMGECPVGMTLDRKDNDGDYQSSNCRWATRAQQSSNTSRTHKVQINGQTVSLAEACRAVGLNYGTAMRRMARGLSPQQAISRKALR